ncbi:helix-turn-helix domain-containing protein [Coleofasciculus chthonoplastes]|nr:helix-turn-helix domain-containing protein [Coleofasciculus chthonoplastes]
MPKEHKTSVQFTAEERETSHIKRLERLLNAQESQPRLVGSSGEEILLPDSVYQALRQVIHAMASGQGITLVPNDREMTTQQAADFLNVSRPYLIKLLEQGDISYTKVGAHRRIRSQDIMAYKQQRDAQRHQHLSEFTAFLQDEGFYDQESHEIER